MSPKSWLVTLGSLFIALGGVPAHAQTYYSLLNGSGEQFVIGGADGPRPWPVQPATTGGSAMSPIGTGAMVPPLLILPNADPARALIQQTSGPDPKQITIPQGVFRRPAPGPTLHGVARYETNALQVRTNADFSGPGFGSAVLKAGGRTGPSVATFTGGSVPGTIRYTKTGAQFGGPAPAKVIAVTRTRVWAYPGPKDMMLPCKHPYYGGSDPCAAQFLESQPNPLVAAGAPVGVEVTTPGVLLMSPYIAVLSVPNTTGLIAQSHSAVGCTGQCGWNPASTVGFPWTTGRITVSQSSVLGDTSFFMITGMDSRVNGVGPITLVSGALSHRSLTGSSAHRGWMRLEVPEPSAALGCVTALAMLGLCHGLLRARR